jgi:tetratricopeptide (TPR) repeat protein
MPLEMPAITKHVRTFVNVLTIGCIAVASSSSVGASAQEASQQSKTTDQSASVKTPAARPQKAVNEKILPLINSGYELINKGQYDKAIKPLEQAVKTDDQSLPARRYLASAQARAGRGKDPLKTMQILAKQTTPGAYAWYIFGEAYMNAGAPPHPPSCFNQAINYRPAYDAARAGVVRSDVQLKDFEDAIAKIQDGLGLTNDPSLRKYYASLYKVVSQAKVAETTPASTATDASSTDPMKTASEGSKPILIKPTGN